MDARRWPLRLLLVTASAAVALGVLTLAPPNFAVAQTPTIQIKTVPAGAPGGVPAPPPGAPATAPNSVTALGVPAPATGELPANVFADGKADGGAKPADPKAAEEAQKKQQEAQKKAQRLQKIQQLNFDRRPSAILRAWSLSDEAALKERQEAKKKAKEGQTDDSAENNAAPGMPAGAAEVVFDVVAPPGVALPPGVVVAQGAVIEVAGVLNNANVAAPPPAGATDAAKDKAPSKEAIEAEKFEEELFLFRRHVTLGDWPKVAKFLKDLPEDEGKAAYKQLLSMLPNSIPSEMGANMPPGMNAQQLMIQQQQMMIQQQQQNGGMPMQTMEQTSLIARDVLALAHAAPHGRDKEQINGLGQLLRLALDRGDSVENFVALIQAERKATPPPPAPLTDREVAKILLGADLTSKMKPFLPEPGKAEADNDREGLNLLSRYFLAIHAEEKKVAQLEQAWTVTLAVLAVGEVDKAQKDEALKRAVELAPRVRADLGQKWLEESFTARPERGVEIIAAIGAAANRGLQFQARDPDARLRALELQKTAVEAMLRSPLAQQLDPKASGLAAEWSRSLALLAGAWLAEAEFSEQWDNSTSLGPRMRRDVYGNFFYMNNMMDENGNMMGQNPNMPRAIPVAKILLQMPGLAWLSKVDDGIRPKYAAVTSQLYLKVGEDEKAFPFVEALATTHPERARQLAEEFLRVWTRNHDPNSERNQRNPYIYMFGFERKAESIPLTRSKQERNLKELAEWVARIRKLPFKELDEKLIAQAFTACHSSAEVYRLEAIESVLGRTELIKPETLATMAQQMRTNLAGLWRNPNVQDQNKTKRKEKDIRAEVLRGYSTAKTVIDQALAKHPETWELLVARAALAHDENNYRQEIEPSSDFSQSRNAAMAQFAEAAQRYAAKLATLSEDDETTSAYETWFYAGLGACDLGAIDEKNQADARQPALIRAAIQALPAEASKRHMNKFANALFTRMSALNPAAKFRYLKGGFEIVGDNEQAIEAKKVYDYYKDLVTEIRLETLVDGPAEVGSGQPFGLFVNLKHTREIEREAGGFGKYLQNQNTGNQFFYNYGRPLENYRDKFTDIVKKAFEEHFEVMSVTFQDEKVNSRATPEYGWRYTPYAYVLLKSKSPKIDKIPPLRLDLDFLDTSGYVIMPVESPALPIDSATTRPTPRPFEKLQVTETLDERQSKDGKLILEVKATALGLVPPLREIVDLKDGDFVVRGTDDQGLSVSRFDADAEGNTIVSERTWLVTMNAAEGLPARPTRYTFPKPKVETADTTYQRFVDADLAKVDPDVDLEAQYGTPSRALWVQALGGIAALIAIIVVAVFLRPAPKATGSGRFAVPDPATPFAVLGLLREIQLQDAVPETKRRELATAIAGLEAHYFAGSNQPAPDLAAIAAHWTAQAT